MDDQQQPGLRVDWVPHVTPAGVTEADVQDFFDALSPHLQALPERAMVEVVFVNDDEMRRLNREYRNVDRTTDVLSFPDGDQHPETGEIMLGAIVVSVDQARRQAEEIGQDVISETRFLLMHGLLHLLGMDHETDQGAMLSEQRRLKQQLAEWFVGGGEQ